MTTQLYMTRHGQTLWNAAGRMQGQLNSDLTELGKHQALWLGERLNDVDLDIIISSSSKRALDTAELIRGSRNIEIIKKETLREMHLGSWQGMHFQDIKENFPKAYDDFWHHPHKYVPVDGEGFEQLNKRVIDEVECIIKKYEHKKILIVAHGVVLRALITYFEEKPQNEFWQGIHMDSTCLNLLEIKGDQREFAYQGDVSHHKVK